MAYSKKHKGLKNYLTANRSVDIFSLSTSFVASALGAWILFGPASAATWGGIGAVIGYALGSAAPMLFLYNFGPKIRKAFPKGLTLTEYIKKRDEKVKIKPSFGRRISRFKRNMEQKGRNLYKSDKNFSNKKKTFTSKKKLNEMAKDKTVKRQQRKDAKKYSKRRNE